ncbi:MAG: DNA-3-methyladenine glycosylase, partial [Cryobacterium sp.]
MQDLNGFHPATRQFFARDSLVVGPELLGTVLARTDADGTVGIRLTEVEAYGGERDPGAHAFRGQTARTASMFGEAGHVYCYFTYGMHHAVNLITGQVGQPYGCLVRAGEVVVGADLARARREAKPRLRPLRDWELARGPACVAQSLAATRVNDGDDLIDGEWRLWLPDDRGADDHGADVPGADVPGTDVPGTYTHSALPYETGPRVGLSGPSGDGHAFPWRYWLPGEPSVSAYKPAAARKGRPA